MITNYAMAEQIWGTVLKTKNAYAYKSLSRTPSCSYNLPGPQLHVQCKGYVCGRARSARRMPLGRRSPIDLSF